jgi:predicted PurR-regulated permease PerM
MHTRIAMLLKVFVGALIIALAILGLFEFRMIVLATTMGLMIGVLPEPLIRRLRRWLRMPHGLSAILIAALMLTGFAGMGYGIYVTVVPQLKRLAEQAPAIFERLNTQKDIVIERVAGVGLDLEQLDVGAMVQGAMQMVVTGVSVGVEGVAGVLVVFMIAIFVAANYESYGCGALSMFPPRIRPRVAELSASSAEVVRRWLFGQVRVVMITGALTAIAMLLIGIDYWLLIAAMTVVLDFIPFVGALITGAVAVVLTLGTEPEKVWWVLLAFIGIQQIESNVVLPVVLKGAVRLPEAHLLVFVVLMGSAFGILGVFVAPPLFAILHHLYRKAYIPWIERREASAAARLPVQ